MDRPALPRGDLIARGRTATGSITTRGRHKTVERGYDADHKRERARLLPLAIGKPCPRCGRIMLGTSDPIPRLRPLDLDHLTPIALGGKHGRRAIAHRYCNRAAGARLLNALRRARAHTQPPPQPRPTRNW